MTPFDFTSPQAVPLIGSFVILLVTLTYNTISKVFDLFWKQHVKDLNEVLDIDKKLNHQDKHVRELVELHQARFLIQKERVREYRQQKYVLSFDWLGDIPHLIFKLICYLNYLMITVAAYNVFITGSLNPILVCILVFAAIIILFRLTLFLLGIFKRRFFWGTKSLSTYSVSLIHNPTTSGYWQTVGSFKVKIPTEKEGYEYFDYIGKPFMDVVKIYKRVLNTKQDAKPVTYAYQYTRAITPLEVEWVTKLNQINSFYRRTTPYIPYLKPQPEKGISYSAYYLLEK